MGKRKSTTAIRNAELRRDARHATEKREAVKRAERAHGGQRNPGAPADDPMVAATGVDAFEALAESNADDFENAVNNPDFEETENEQRNGFTGIFDEIAPPEKANDGPEMGG